MIKNIIFDFGGVLVDWNPRHLYDPYFGDTEKTSYFLDTICPYAWNVTVDAGRSTADAMDERIALYPEWEKEIRMYFGEWIKMMGGEIPGMYGLMSRLKARGYPLYGLTNWSAETFPLIHARYPVFSLLDGIVVSGEEHVAKPDPKIYRILLDRYGLQAGESVFIDDNKANIDGAAAVGIGGIVFTSREELEEKLQELLQ